MYYNECSICGAALDPGERCDCERDQAVHQEEAHQREGVTNWHQEECLQFQL